MSFRIAWRACGWCTRQTGRALLWSVWLVLLLSLVAQIYFLSARNLPVPGPVRRALERSLAEHGLALSYDRSFVALDGRLLLENARLSQLSSRDAFATAGSVYLRVDPWKLLVGTLDWEDLRVSGLDLQLPALWSGTGATDVIAGDIDFAARPSGRDVELSHFTGYIGRVPVTASGLIAAPASAAAKPDAKVVVQRTLASYFKTAARLQDAERWLSALDAPRVDLALRPGVIDVAVSAEAVDLRALPGRLDGRASRVALTTRLPASFRFAAPLRVEARVGSLELPALSASAKELALEARATLDSDFRPAAATVDLQLGSARWRKLEAGPLALVATSDALAGPVRADASLQLAGSAWRTIATADPRTGEAAISLDGFVGAPTLAFAGAQIGKDLAALLDPREPAPLHAAARFAPGWKLAAASGRLHSGPVRVGDVKLDETGTEFFYDGANVLCDNLVLRQGESLAHGSYSMSTATQEFRFLLTGGLRPAGISGWFHAWWTNFWSTFDFSQGVPIADVDVQGRWGDLTATRVFVVADGEETGLRGVPFDRVRTRLFLRPHWFDILHFHVEQGDQTAEGRLARALSNDQEAWLYMDFAADSTLPLKTISTLFEKESAELLAPYAFTTPPKLRLTGRVDSPASPVGKREHIDIDLSSKGPMTYHGFPLADLNFEASIRDDVIELPLLTVGFAGGRAHGKARLVGPEGKRRLSFDMNLADANVGAITRAVAQLQPSADSAPAPLPASAKQEKPKPALSEKAAEAARQRQQRLDDLTLVLNITAEGDFGDTYSYKGSGRGVVTGPELAQLNLLGPLSEAMRNTIVNLGSFSLTTADAPFSLNGDRLRFENLRVTGPSALIQAEGDYLLRSGNMEFTAKIHPFEESSSLVGNAVGFVLSPLSKVFEVKLQGTLAKPSWIFSYGPSRLINTLTGSDKKPETQSSADASR